LYSSIEEKDRKRVIEKCYWPILHLASREGIPIGIELTGNTLEIIRSIDMKWIKEFKRLLAERKCELIGSGYSQIIGPVVPAEVNMHNQQFGMAAYERIVNCRPKIALINEQAYSGGLISHYKKAGYKAIVMEWNNPYRYHPEWEKKWRYYPQLALGPEGNTLPVIWNNSIAFQKFQRYAHGETSLDEYVEYLKNQAGGENRFFSLYGNDIEIFDFRPSRYDTEIIINKEGEWKRIGLLFKRLSEEPLFSFIPPSRVLTFSKDTNAFKKIRLESPEQPIPVKKQEKYNITRWTLTGRDDMGINTRCYKIYNYLTNIGENRVIGKKKTEGLWKKLCFLWSSDFRTHITEKRWSAYKKDLSITERKLGLNRSGRASCDIFARPKKKSHPLYTCNQVVRNGHYLTIETELTKIHLNCRRGLAIDKLWFKNLSNNWLCGTLPHGYYDDISLGADYFSGHLLFEAPGKPKITDLNFIEPIIEEDLLKESIIIKGIVSTPLGPVRKGIRIFKSKPRIELNYHLNWQEIPNGSLSLGYITLMPLAFNRNELYYRTHNGGYNEETFRLAGKHIAHGNAVSLFVSDSQGLGITNGMIELGDTSNRLRVEIDKTKAALIGLITYRELEESYFCRLALSVRGMDETSRPQLSRTKYPENSFQIALSAYK